MIQWLLLLCLATLTVTGCSGPETQLRIPFVALFDGSEIGCAPSEAGPNAGDGRRNPFKSEFIRGFVLSDDERDELIAFLNALTDELLLTDSRWSDPH